MTALGMLVGEANLRCSLLRSLATAVTGGLVCQVDPPPGGGQLGETSTLAMSTFWEWPSRKSFGRVSVLVEGTH